MKYILISLIALLTGCVSNQNNQWQSLFNGQDFLLPVSHLQLPVLQDQSHLDRYDRDHQAKNLIFLRLESTRVTYKYQEGDLAK